MKGNKNQIEKNLFGQPECIFIVLSLHVTEIQYSNTLKISFLAQALFSVAYENFCPLGSVPCHPVGSCLPGWRGCWYPGEQGQSHGDALLSSCCWSFAYLWTWQLPQQLTSSFFSWSVGHSCGSAQGVVSNTCIAVPALHFAVHKAFCSVFP